MQIRNFWKFLPVVFFYFITACNQTSSPAIDNSFQSSDGIIFASDRDGKETYYYMAPDGSNAQTINLGELEAKRLTSKLTWSSTLNKFFVSALQDGNSDIFSIDPDGNNLKNLTQSEGYFNASPIPSPDGKQIAFIKSTIDSEIYLMDPDGSNAINITNWPSDHANIVWGPDSSKIFFSSMRPGVPNIYSAEIKNLKLTNISNGSGLDGSFSISPDGKKIAFDSDRDGYMDIFVVNSEGGDARNLTNSQDIRDVEPIWSPDGEFIVFRSDQDGGSDIYIISVSDNSVKNLTQTPQITETEISWSPDSNFLIFVAKTDAQLEIFRIGLDGSKPINLSQNSANDYSPIWVNDFLISGAPNSTE